MNVRLLHPEGVIQVPVHHQMSVAEGSKVISLAGQVSWDAEGQLVGAGDLTAQTAQCYLNIATALSAAGATAANLTRTTAYVVHLDSAKTAQVGAGREQAAEILGVALQQPGTYVGVTSLFHEDYLIEIEATAVLP